MLATSTVAFPPDTDRRPPAAPVGATGPLANGVVARDTALPTRALLISVLTAAGPALGDHVVLRQGHGRQQTVEAGTLVARYPAGFLLRSSAGRCFVNYVDLWSADAVLERPADAVARTDAVLALRRRRMPKPRRWGAVVMRRGPHHP